MREYKISMDTFKENVLDLQPNEVIVKKYEKLNPTIKSAFTKAYNENFKATFVRKKKKEETEPEENLKYDADGNIIEEIKEVEGEGQDDVESDDSNLNVKTKKPRATKVAAKKGKKKKGDDDDDIQTEGVLLH